MEWRPVIVFMASQDVMELRTLNRFFNSLATMESTWREYAAGVIECGQFLVSRGRAEEALPIVRDTGATLDKMCKVWRGRPGKEGMAYDEIKGKLRLFEAYIIHCMHWTTGYCPMKWGVESSMAAWLALRHFTMLVDGWSGKVVTTDKYETVLPKSDIRCNSDDLSAPEDDIDSPLLSPSAFARLGGACDSTSFLDDIQQATVWALCLYAWNGARYQMKLPGATQARFRPFFNAAKLAHEKADSSVLLHALATFAEGYVNFAIGFSGAAGPEAFQTAFALQKEGYETWVTERAAAGEPPDAMSVEMAERLARTARFVAAHSGCAQELPVSLYNTALEASLLVWPERDGCSEHPYTKALRAILSSYRPAPMPPPKPSS